MDIENHIQKLQKSQRIEFSSISGYNYYYLPEELECDGAIHALHAPSDTLVYLVPINKGAASIPFTATREYVNLILSPIKTNHFEWPVDLISCKQENGKNLLYHVFTPKTYLDYVPLKKLMYQRRDSRVLDWRNENIAKVCISFLMAMKQLDESKYNYIDFNIERILYNETSGHVVLRYSPRICSRGDQFANGSQKSAEISKEFAAPYLYAESYSGNLPFQADYYSIAAILFRLMIGRLPYEGRGLSNHGYVFDPMRDVDDLAHNNYFKYYHNYPHFIFDDLDDSNRVAPMQENDLVRERWECLPSKIKQMFQDSLCETTALKLTADKLCSPAQWIEACKEWCWSNFEVGGE